MKNSYTLAIVSVMGILISGCQRTTSEAPIVSERYIHKYGYAVSKEEWDSKNYPGQVITTMRNGVTVVATYENGVLHGNSTTTYPHSQIIESFIVYDHGNLIRELQYDSKGMPVRETIVLSPSRYTVTLWYSDGTPLSTEEYSDKELLEGQYFTTVNDTESRVEKGNGLRVRRDQQGTLISRDQVQQGYMVKREAFYPNGTPESITHYQQGRLHGEKKAFAQNGEPLFIQEWVNGKLHGKVTTFKNGSKEHEICYVEGLKNGPEVHFLDGEQISQEVNWENDKQHGAAVYHIDGNSVVQWYYDGKHVSERKYKELNRLDDMIGNISQDVRVDRVR